MELVTINKIYNYKYVFWDFDGVIKETVKIKNEAFITLFSGFNASISKKISDHLSKNSGLSRFEKIPIYLKIANIKYSESDILFWTDKYNKIVYERVINSKYVDGVLDLIKSRYRDQLFIIVTATPEYEIKKILLEIGISRYFSKVFGSPQRKFQAILKFIDENNIPKDQCLMIGDSMEDYICANKCKIDFLLRRHELNINIFNEIKVPYLDNFKNP